MADHYKTSRDRVPSEIEFGRYRLTKDRMLQFPDGTQIQLSARLATVLRELAAAKGATISRPDLIQRCWPSGEISDESLTRAIADLRTIFRTHGDNCVETVYGLGYRFNPARSDVASEYTSYYQEAWQRMYQRQRATLTSAEDLFTQVVEQDEGQPSAWLGLAETQFHRMQLGYTTTTDSAPKTLQFLDHALNLDSAYADALALKGLLVTWAEWDFAGAEALLARSRELRPDAYVPNQASAWHKLSIGQFESAEHHAEAATAARPLSATARGISAFARWYRGDAETSLRLAREMRRIDAYGPVSLGLAAVFEAASGVSAEAVSMAEQSFELLPESPVVGAIFAYSLARDGHSRKAKRLLESQTKSGMRIGSTTMASLAWMELGEHTPALAALKWGFATHCTWLLPMLHDPRIQSLNCEPIKAAIFRRPL